MPKNKDHGGGALNEGSSSKKQRTDAPTGDLKNVSTKDLKESSSGDLNDPNVRKLFEEAYAFSNALKDVKLWRDIPLNSKSAEKVKENYSLLLQTAMPYDGITLDICSIVAGYAWGKTGFQQAYRLRFQGHTGTEQELDDPRDWRVERPLLQEAFLYFHSRWSVMITTPQHPDDSRKMQREIMYEYESVNSSDVVPVDAKTGITDEMILTVLTHDDRLSMELYEFGCKCFPSNIFNSIIIYVLLDNIHMRDYARKMYWLLTVHLPSALPHNAQGLLDAYRSYLEMEDGLTNHGEFMVACGLYVWAEQCGVSLFREARNDLGRLITAFVTDHATQIMAVVCSNGMYLKRDLFELFMQVKPFVDAVMKFTLKGIHTEAYGTLFQFRPWCRSLYVNLIKRKETYGEAIRLHNYMAEAKLLDILNLNDYSFNYDTGADSALVYLLVCDLSGDTFEDIRPLLTPDRLDELKSRLRNPADGPVQANADPPG